MDLAVHEKEREGVIGPEGLLVVDGLEGVALVGTFAECGTKDVVVYHASELEGEAQEGGALRFGGGRHCLMSLFKEMGIYRRGFGTQKKVTHTRFMTHPSNAFRRCSNVAVRSSSGIYNQW